MKDKKRSLIATFLAISFIFSSIYDTKTMALEYDNTNGPIDVFEDSSPEDAEHNESTDEIILDDSHADVNNNESNESVTLNDGEDENNTSEDSDIETGDETTDDGNVSNEDDKQLSLDDVEHHYLYTYNDDGTHTITCEDDGCDYECVEDCEYDDTGICIKCGGTKDEPADEIKMVEKELFIELDGYIINASGMMPEDTKLEATVVDNKNAEDIVSDTLETDDTFEAKVSFDIKLMSNDAEYQPVESGETVDITITGLSDVETYDVYRITDDNTVTDMNATNENDSVLFETDHFTIYTIGNVVRNTEEYKYAWDISQNNDGSVMAYLYKDGFLDIKGDGNAMEFIQGYWSTNKEGKLNMYRPDGTYPDNYGYVDFKQDDWRQEKVVPWTFYRTEIKSAHISNGVKATSFYLWFNGCQNMESISIDEGVGAETKNLKGMFRYCLKLDNVIIPAGFGTNAKDVVGFFQYNKNLKTFSLPENFGAKATNIGNFFQDCTSLEVINNLPTNFGAAAINSGYLFQNSSPSTYGESKLRSITLPEGFVKNPNKTGLHYMFQNCVNLETINGIENLDTTGVINAGYAFYNCKKLKNIDLKSFKTPKLKHMTYMFSDCTSLESIDISGFTTNNVISMQGLFRNCTAAKQINLGNINTSNCTNFRGMFNNCRSLEQIDVSMLDTSNATTLAYMFFDARNLKSLDVSNIRSDKANDMHCFVGNNYELTNLDLSNIVINDAASKTLDYSEGETNDIMLLHDCWKLETIILPKEYHMAFKLPRTYFIEKNGTIDKTKPYTEIPAASEYYKAVLKKNGNIIGQWDISAEWNGCIWATLYDDGTLYIISNGSKNKMMPFYGGAVVENEGTDNVKVHKWHTVPDGSSEDPNYLFGKDNPALNDVTKYRTNAITPWSYYRSQVTKVIIPNDFTASSLFSFMDGMYKVESIELPEGFGSETQYFDNCFRAMESLKQLDLPAGFGSNAIQLVSTFGRTNLTHIDLPAGFGKKATRVDYCFAWMNQMKSITLPAGFASNATAVNSLFEHDIVLETVNLNSDFGLKANNMQSMLCETYSLKSINLPEGFGKNTDNIARFAALSNFAITKENMPAGFGSNATDLAKFAKGNKTKNMSFPDGFGAKATNLSEFARGIDGQSHLQSIVFPAGFGANATTVSYFLMENKEIKKVEFPAGFGDKATSMQSVLDKCYNLTDVTFPDGFAKSAQNIAYFFVNDHSIKNLDLSNWDVRNVTHMEYAFADMTSLETLSLKDWELNSLIQDNHIRLNSNPKFHMFIAPKAIRAGRSLSLGDEKTFTLRNNETNEAITYLSDKVEPNAVYISTNHTYDEDDVCTICKTHSVSEYKIKIPATVALNETKDSYQADVTAVVNGNVSNGYVLRVKTDKTVKLSNGNKEIDLDVDNPIRIMGTITTDKNLAATNTFIESPQVFTLKTEGKDIPLGTYNGVMNFTYSITRNDDNTIATTPYREDIIEPTCDKPGSYDEVVYDMDGTELSRKTITVPALGHSFEPWQLVDSKLMRQCKVCNKLEQGYEVSIVENIGIASTTGAGVYKPGDKVTISAATYPCAKFAKWTGDVTAVTKDYTFTMPNKNVQIVAETTAIESSKEHKWKTVVSEPATCNTDSVETKVCEHCGATIVTHDHKMTGHIADTSKDVIVKPTCTTGGYTTHTCKDCGATYSDTFTEELGHNYVNGECTNCHDFDMSKMDAGLYSKTSDGKYTVKKTWNQLISEGIFTFNSSTGLLTQNGNNTTTNVYKYANTLDGTLILPEGVKNIDNNFAATAKIKELYIPSTLQWFGAKTGNTMMYRSFEKVEKYYINESNKYLKLINGAVYSYDEKVLLKVPVATSGTFVIKDGCTTIQSAALSFTIFDEIIIPNSVTKFNGASFRNLQNVKELNVPASVTSMGVGFACVSSKLMKINIASDNPNYTSVDGVVYSKDMTRIMACPAGRTGSYIIPESVTKIENNAFDGCNKLTGITIPESVTAIGSWAFSGCNNVKNMKIPSKVTRINDGSFQNTYFTNVVIPKNVTYIGVRNFNNANIKTVTFEDTTHKWKMTLVTNGAANSAAATEPINVTDTAANRNYFNKCIYYWWQRQ